MDFNEVIFHSCFWRSYFWQSDPIFDKEITISTLWLNPVFDNVSFDKVTPLCSVLITTVWKTVEAIFVTLENYKFLWNNCEAKKWIDKRLSTKIFFQPINKFGSFQPWISQPSHHVPNHVWICQKVYFVWRVKNEFLIYSQFKL